MKLTFCGAARTVTGSCHMLTTSAGKILVDCGMRQGEDVKGEYGEDRFPFDPAEIDIVLATHAHIDHIGLIPLLVKRGYTGKILTTTATSGLATIMLPDSAHIQEQEAEWQNRKNERAGKAHVDPLYTVKDVEKTLKQFHGVPYGKTVEILPGVTAKFTDVGHLLGSAAIEMNVTEDGKTSKIVFSGDIGRTDRPILNDPESIGGADYLIMESTYGDRDHALTTNADKEKELASVIRAALARGGNLVIPSFAVGRTQELLYYIKHFLFENTVPGLEKIPVYIDSPLAIQATKVYERCAEGYYDDDARALSHDGSPFDFPTLCIAETTDESKLINELKQQKIIISASGMCDAGRIRHHLKHNLYRADSTVMFAGYQAVGTLGRTLVDGAKKVKLFGEDVRVNAHIVQTDGFSGHAGRSELIDWAEKVQPAPREIFLVHGEEEAIFSLSAALEERGLSVTVPSLCDEIVLVAEKESPSVRAAKGAKKKPAKRTAETPAEADAASAKTEAPAPKAARAAYDPDGAIPLAATAPGYESRALLKRIDGILERSEERRSPDMELKRAILEADLKALADKWETIIN